LEMKRSTIKGPKRRVGASREDKEVQDTPGRIKAESFTEISFRISQSERAAFARVRSSKRERYIGAKKGRGGTLSASRGRERPYRSQSEKKEGSKA